MRELAAEILSMNGYEVTEARHGVEALELFESTETAFDLIVTDVVMPQMGGKELAQKIKEIDAEMKVLFLSGYTNTAIAEQGLRVDERTFLQKPFTPVAFASKVRGILDE